jgi:chromosomal replication initiator protein
MDDALDFFADPSARTETAAGDSRLPDALDLGSRGRAAEAADEPADRLMRPRAASTGDAGAGEAARAKAQLAQRGQRVRTILRARLGEDVFSSWFATLEIDEIDEETLKASVPVKFLQNWIQTHYYEDLLGCCRAEFKEIERVVVSVRQPVAIHAKAGGTASGESAGAVGGQPRGVGGEGPHSGAVPTPSGSGSRTQIGGFEGSPLDPRYTFDSFVVGTTNRIAHAGAMQVAETVMEDSRAINPLYIHSTVGLGKTHLLHAIAWEVRRRQPGAQLLYLTAERFRYQFVTALKSQDAASFKEKFRSIDILLIDDLEFMQGERTEEEFDHVVNTLLDGGRQLVVASARAPAQIERLSERMKSRLQRGLVTELGPLDRTLRLDVLARRVAEKRAIDPTFMVPDDVLELLAERLVESGRELEGAVTRLQATWQYTRTPITIEIAETIIRDLVQGLEPRRIKIEDILRIVSRHFGVSKGDILSQRRHRSVVWPRQIGMYLAKQLTARSLPEIGRRFGNRDHTTVLHAIRKIEGVLKDDTRLKDELDELKRLLNH